MKKPIPFGKYYLLERINVGGMAEVFRAKAYGVEGFERLVAVKRILPNIAEDKEFIGMFIDEAKLAVQLNHANIAQIFDLGMVDSSYYIALEHIHGRDLRSIFERCRNFGQPMPIAQAAFIIMKVCEGLDYAHNKRDQSGRELNLVHRDVSPQNVLVSFEGEVKIIDFGIAKAAGKGSKTQAGILKGKFGYMSPEQVRGLAIDRRSDIFSCGIVLYELLTGERLFVGESDFSTLEKVRNVEILPPSTYNRRIPEELERIVLRALAKDVDDRYPNAIDLHDELQAFVYQAGEFYSRKDLAAWMKETFGREIANETAKLESYRQLRPPDAQVPSAQRPALPGARRSATRSMPEMLPAAAPDPYLFSGLPDVAMSADTVANGRRGDRLAWDDDESETQIYDSPEDLVASPSAPTHTGRPASTRPMGSMTGDVAPIPEFSLPLPGNAAGLPPLQTARGWDSGPQLPALPLPFPSGSNQSVSPFSGAPLSGVNDEEYDRTVPVGEEVMLPSPFDTILPGLPGDGLMVPEKRRSSLYIGLAAIIALLVGGGLGGYFLLGDLDGGVIAGTEPVDESEPERASPAVPETGDTEGLSKEALAATGFNLIVEPPEAEVKLDGKVLDLTPPMKVRNIQPGEHELVIDGPPGFFSKNQTIVVEAGKAELMTVRLEPLEIWATFTSDPPGAEVFLRIGEDDEELIGKSPVKHKLDPKKTYAVRFAKRGYQDKSEPVTISGRTEELVAAVLERDRERERETKPPKTQPKSDDVREGGDSGSKTAKPGTLMLGAKPPCQIFVDGKDTGLKTPQRNLELPAGRHRIMLVNKEYGIKEVFSVTIKSGETTKQIKDFSSQIP